MKRQKLYKERTKRWHDARIKERQFQVGKKMLVHDSHFHLFPGKLQSRWGSPFEVNKVFPSVVLELKKFDGHTFKINAYQAKAYQEGLQQVCVIVHFFDP